MPLLYEDVIIFIITKANQRIFGKFKPMFLRHGLTPTQALVLNALYQNNGLSVGEIGNQLILDSATLSGVLDRMVDSGWITKDIYDEDRRVTKIYLTEKAIQTRDALLNDIEATHRKVLSVFRPEERLLLERMIKDLGK
jgi:DNA-binding MarR family transcriptional regulator